MPYRQSTTVVTPLLILALIMSVYVKSKKGQKIQGVFRAGAITMRASPLIFLIFYFLNKHGVFYKPLVFI